MNQQMYEKKLKRMSGMSAHKRSVMNEKLSVANNWNINCKSCGMRVYGNIKELLNHRDNCNVEKS